MLTIFEARIFDLDLSDFHRITSEGHVGSFYSFIKSFKLRPDLTFNTSLLRLVLPDLTLNADALFSDGLEFLSDKLGGIVSKMTELTAYDYLASPVKDAMVALLVIMFQVEVLNWRKLDLDLHVLKEECKLVAKQRDRYGFFAAQDGLAESRQLAFSAISEQYNRKVQSCAQDSLRELWLYSSGNKAVLFHWTSVDGLASLEHVRM